MAERPNNHDFATALAALPRERTALLPALLLAQEAFGAVTREAEETIATHLRLTVNEVDGVATAYPDLRRQPAGQRLIRVCTGLPCALRGGEALLATLEDALGLRAGETARDGGVTLETTACCFACGVAPVIEVDGACRGRADAALVRALAGGGGETAPGAGGGDDRHC